MTISYFCFVFDEAKPGVRVHALQTPVQSTLAVWKLSDEEGGGWGGWIFHPRRWIRVVSFLHEQYHDHVKFHSFFFGNPVVSTKRLFGFLRILDLFSKAAAPSLKARK